MHCCSTPIRANFGLTAEPRGTRAEYAGRFTEFDLMWEGKDKNLGAAEIARHLTGAI